MKLIYVILTVLLSSCSTVKIQNNTLIIKTMKLNGLKHIMIWGYPLTHNDTVTGPKERNIYHINEKVWQLNSGSSDTEFFVKQMDKHNHRTFDTVPFNEIFMPGYEYSIAIEKRRASHQLITQKSYGFVIDSLGNKIEFEIHKRKLGNHANF